MLGSWNALNGCGNPISATTLAGAWDRPQVMTPLGQLVGGEHMAMGAFETGLGDSKKKKKKQKQEDARYGIGPAVAEDAVIVSQGDENHYLSEGQLYATSDNYGWVDTAKSYGPYVLLGLAALYFVSSSGRGRR